MNQSSSSHYIHLMNLERWYQSADTSEGMEGGWGVEEQPDFRSALSN